ncbi:hypothetical protein EV715DRAFT_211640 [Schizophyllum commune]
MPLDILFEIFKLVDPVDLLHLSHANKALRSTLLRKSCKWIWEYSVKHYRTPIPPCMDDRLPLPQYINLLFTQNCFECGSSKGKHALWCFFDRLCSKCLQEKCARTVKISSRVQISDQSADIWPWVGP